MKSLSSSASWLLAFGLSSLPVLAGTWSFTNLTGDDTETGIETSKTYTHLVDFGPDAEAATINGVKFTSKGRTGANYTMEMGGGDFPNNGQGVFEGTGLGDLLSDFYYGSAGNGLQTLTLTGLREAHTYRLTFFVSGWAGAPIDISVSDAPGVVTRIDRGGGRWVPDPASPDTFEPTGAGSPGAGLSYEYVAPAGGTIVVKMDAVQDGDTFHHYGFVNELVAIPGDSDGDGMPDIYEKANGLNPAVKDGTLDLDQDGVTNLAEYEGGTQANNPDSDGDGLKDGVETGTGTWVSASNTGTNPLNPDTDGDGLKDGEESNSSTFVDAAHPGTNPLKADTDSDGFNDGFEAQRGFNPNLASSTPESALGIRTAIEFRFNTATGVSYRIEGSVDLVQWSTIEANIAGNGGAGTRFYSTENTPIRFYRLQRN